MLSLTTEQTATIARLLDRARSSYSRPGSQGLRPSSCSASLSTLSDDDEGALIRNSSLSGAVLISLTYLSEESIDSGDADRAVVIVLRNGSTLGAPYDLTGEVTVTAPFDPLELADNEPQPTAYELENTLMPEIVRGTTIVMGSVVKRARRAAAAVE